MEPAVGCGRFSLAVSKPSMVKELLRMFKGVLGSSGPCIFERKHKQGRHGQREINESSPAKKHYIACLQAVPGTDPSTESRSRV